MSADELPASMLDLLSHDWNDVLRHAKGMQLAIDRFTMNIKLAVNEGHDSRSPVAQDAALYADQLRAVGEQNLAFVETIEQDVEPLVKALISEPSDDGAAQITQSFATAQASAIRELGTAALYIVYNAPCPEEQRRRVAEVTAHAARNAERRP